MLLFVMQLPYNMAGPCAELLLHCAAFLVDHVYPVLKVAFRPYATARL